MRIHENRNIIVYFTNYILHDSIRNVPKMKTSLMYMLYIVLYVKYNRIIMWKPELLYHGCLLFLWVQYSIIYSKCRDGNCRLIIGGGHYCQLEKKHNRFRSYHRITYTYRKERQLNSISSSTLLKNYSKNTSLGSQFMYVRKNSPTYVQNI